jgi:hypothetical protein
LARSSGAATALAAIGVEAESAAGLRVAGSLMIMTIGAASAPVTTKVSSWCLGRTLSGSITTV